MNVFQLIALHPEKDRLNADGSLSVYKRDLGVFKALESAEKMIHIYAADNDTWAYIIKERILDDLALHGHFKQISSFRSYRSYFSDGTLNAENACDDTGENLWYGREDSTIRFKIGDFVSFITDNRIEHGIVGAVPMNKELFENGRCGVEACDDCYLIYTVNGGHFHPFTPCVFPPVIELSDEFKTRLEAVRSENA